MHQKSSRHMLGTFVTGLSLLVMSSFAMQAKAAPPADKTLPANTRFFVPQPADGSVQQVIDLLDKGQRRNALLIAAMEVTPQAVWLTSGAPSDVSAQVKKVLHKADAQQAVPVIVL